MDLIFKILFTLLFVMLSTYVLSKFKNNSNISVFIIIPFIVALLTKYIIGDWDDGFIFTLSDIFYWITILITSYLTLLLYSV